MQALFSKLLVTVCCLIFAVAAYGQNCDAGFTASETNPCGLEVVTFTVTNPNPNFIYNWNFGDPEAEGNNTTGLNDNEVSGELVTHAFTASNTGDSYTVTLSVVGSNGMECDTEMLIINTQPAPVAILSSSEPGNVFIQCPEELISTFSLTVTDNGPGNADSYIIDWGDGSPVETSNTPPSLLSHDYDIGGFFLSYTVIDNSLTCSSSTATYFVYNGTNPSLGIANDGNITVCTPDSISFDFEGYETNTDNTLYYITINDGSDVITFTQNTLPDSYTHLFDSISCGTTSGTQVDAYEFLITAINPCGEKEALIRPIRVGRAPISEFTTEGDDPSCDPSTYTFVSQAYNGIGFVNNECSEALSLTWIITPLDGGTVTTVFGNVTADSIVRTFSSGEFLIEHVARNSCGSDTSRQTICVIPIPDASFTFVGANGCAPQTITTTNTSNTIDACAGDAMYEWEIRGSSDECGQLPSFTLLSGTSLTDQDIEIRLDSSGVYEIVLFVTNECGRDSITQNILVQAPPVVSITPIEDACYTGPMTINPSLDAISSCYADPTYTWSFPGGNPATGSGQSPGPVTYNAAGEYTISVTVENECGDNVFTETFELFAPPEIPDITVNSPVCVGGDIVFSNPMPGNLTYEWSGPNGFSSTVPAPTIEDVGVENIGTYTVTVTNPNTGCQNQMDYEVNVTTIAALNITPDPANVCLNQSINLTANGPSSVTWIGPNLSSNSGTTVTFTGTTVGEFMIIATGSDPNESCNGTDTLLVNVRPIPEVDAGGNQFTCQNTNLQLIGSSDDGGTGTGTWSGPNVSPSGIFNASTPGNYTLTYTYFSEFGCDASATVDVCVQSAPEASFTIDEDFGCDNLTVNVMNTSNTLDDCEAATYLWSVNFLNDECDELATGSWGFGGSTNENSVNPVFNFNAPGSYSISLIVENNCGPSTAATETVIVGAEPTVEIDSIDEFCGTAEIDPTFEALACNTEITGYAWDFTGTSGSMNTSTAQNPLNIPYGVGTHTISLTVTNVCGSATDTEEFQVLQGPDLNYQLPEEVCVGDVIIVMGNVDGDGLEYEWTSTGPSPLNIMNTDDAFPTINFTGVDIGVYTIGVVVQNLVCDPVELSFEVLVNDVPTAMLSPIEDACDNITFDPQATYSLPIDLIDSVRWTFPVGSTPLTSTDLDPGPVTQSTTGFGQEVSLTIYNACGSSTVTETFDLLVGPELDLSLDTAFVCLGNSIMVINSSLGDNLEYDWSVTPMDGVNINDATSATPIITFNGGVGEHTITATIGNDLCGNLTWTATVLVSDIPTATLGMIEDACDNITFDPQATYSLPVGLIDSVRWTFPVGSVPLTSTDLDPGPVTQSTTGSGQEVSLTIYNACGSSTVTETFDLLVGPVLDLSLDTSFVCLGNSVLVINSSLGDNLEYAWSVSPMAGVTINDATSPTPTITFNGEVGEHIITATVGNDLCGELTWMATVLVSTIPTATLDPIEDACDNITFDPQATYSLPVDLIDSVRWTFPAGSVPLTSTDLDPGPVTQSTTGFGQEVSLTVYNACGSSTVTETFDLLVGPVLDLSLDTAFVCLGNSVMVINNSLGDNLEYAWSVSPMAGVTINDATSPTPTITFNGDVGEHVITATVGNDLCGELTWMATVLVSTIPTATLDPIEDACDNITFDPQATYSIPIDLIDSVRWTFPVGSTPLTSTDLDPGPVTQSTTGFGQEVSLTIYNACGSSTVTETFDLLVGPVLDLSLDTAFVCLGNSVLVINSSLGDNLEYAWSVSPMAGVTIDDANSPTPTITFNGDVGEHIITATVGNDLCGELTWMATVLVSTIPTATLDPIEDACDNITFDPQATYSLAVDLIDSVRWTFPVGSTPLTSTELDPGPVTQSTTGFGQEVSLTIYNACGSSTVTETFDLLVGPVLDLSLDTAFVCLGNSVMVINNSLGDNLEYDWSVSPMAGVTINDATSPTPTITFNGEVGEHIITATVGNDLCGELTWMATVLVSTIPTATLDPIEDACDNITFDPQATYSIPIDLIDSVRWTFPVGSTPLTSTDLDPGPVTQSTTGFGQEVSLTVYNACGSTTVTETFDLLVGPVLDLSLDTSFVCLGNSVLVINSSLGDNLEYTWSVSPMAGVTIDDANSPTPTITFNGEVGEHIITATVGNDLCGELTWMATVLVSTIPTATLDPIEDACDNITFDPQATYSLPVDLIDSVRWTFPAGSTPLTSTELDPGPVTQSTTGFGQEVSLTVYNACGSTTVMETFDLLVGPVLDLSLDTSFVCLGNSVMVINNSLGDNLEYTWSVSPMAGVTIDDATSPTPTITFNGDVGEHVITATVGNDLCGELTWMATVLVSTIPTATLDPIEDACDNITFDPQATYSLPVDLIDSVRWTFPVGSTPLTSTELDPGPVTQSTTGFGQEVSLTIYNACGSSTVTETFDLLVGPVLDLSLDTSFVCLGNSVMVINNSLGDNLEYDWSVSPMAGVTIDDATSPTPIITFNGDVGEHIITAMVGNDLCGILEWNSTVLVSMQPEVMLDSIPDACDGLMLSPGVVYSDTTFIDEYAWTIFNENDSLLFSFDTPMIPEVTFGVGVYTVYNAITNRCGTSVDSVSFQVYASPELDISIDPNFVCADGDNTVVVTNNSTGNITDYLWTSDPPGTVMISDPTAGDPVFTFPDTGLYVLTVEVSNPVCEEVFWMDTVLVSEIPSVEINELGTYCGDVLLEPLAIFSDTSRIDSVRWLFPGGVPETVSTFVPGEIFYATPGLYTVSVMVYNGCGVEVDVATFRVFEPIDVSASLSDTFSCTLPFEVIAMNESTGDSLSYEWDVVGNVTFDPLVEDPVFIFQDTGVYEITLRVFNDICGEQFWRDTVTILTLPQPTLTGVDEFCNEVSLTPEIDYFTYRVDSVRWDFAGSQLMPPTSSELFPADIPYVGAGTYIYNVMVFNACGSVSLQDTFVIDTIPQIILGPTDTICITDGLFTLPAAIPPGGIWRDSLARPGVVTEDGIFDPVVAGGGVTVLEYEYTIGACVVFTYKNIFVVDLSFVTVEPDPLDVCVSESAYVLNNGIPAGGWYEGQGVTQDSILNATSLGVGVFTLTYYYQLPGTECIEAREFTLNVQPLPAPEIFITDSLCVNVPVQMFDVGTGAVSYLWNTSDGGVYTAAAPFHTFTSTGMHTIQLITTSEFDCVDSTEVEVFVSGPPEALFEMDTTMGCAILPVNFNNLTNGYQFVTYAWDFGNGEASTLEQPGTVFYDQGILQDTTYFVMLTATNHCGTDTYQDSVIVFPSPLARMDLSQQVGCTPLYVEFNNLTVGLPETFEWYIDGVLYSTDSIPLANSFVALDSMNVTYEIMLVAFNECGSDTTIQNIVVQPDIIRAFFSVDSQVGCSPFTVQFNNSTSPDSIITYDWFFGDGSSSQNEDPVHTFYVTGDTSVIYQVTLIADNGCGIDSLTIPITVHPEPEVAFMPPPITCARDTVFFTNLSVDVTNPIWSFGDGDTLTMIENPGHVYQNPGTYTVTLTAFAIGTGCPSTYTDTVFIREIPLANLTAGPLFGCPDLAVTFTNQSQNAIFYEWDFGNGNTAVGEGPHTHNYTTPGVYQATLTAIDEFGCAHDTLSSEIIVYEVPEIDFTFEADRDCGVPTEVCFTNLTVNGGGYLWDFGNGNVATENDPCEDFTMPGVYQVSLTATNAFECTTTLMRDLEVYGEPLARINGQDTTLCIPGELVLTHDSEYTTFVEWQLSNGIVSNMDSLLISPVDTGVLDVTLIVGNDSGCTDTLTLQEYLRIYPTPTAAFDFSLQPDLPSFTYSFVDLSSEDAILFYWNFGDSETIYPVEDTLHEFNAVNSKRVTHWVENSFGCVDTASAIIDFPQEGHLYIPNIFEPEILDSGKNIFQPKGIGLIDYHIAVYARNGQLVWESSALDDEGSPVEGWNGTFQGELMPPGTFVWKVHRAVFLGGLGWKGMANQRGRERTSGYLYLVR